MTKEYGAGFKEASLWRMVQFAELFPDQQIVAILSQELSWSHFVDLFPIKDSLKRDFYAEMCRIEKWNVRTLRKKIGSMLYERTAISKKPKLVAKAELEALRKEDVLSPDLIFRDPYVLQFLNLNDRYKDKWSFICAGSTNMSVETMRNLQWDLFSALEKSKRG